MKPYKIFASDIENSALDQFYSALKQDFSVRGALMPDAPHRLFATDRGRCRHHRRDPAGLGRI